MTAPLATARATVKYKVTAAAGKKKILHLEIGVLTDQEIKSV